MNGTPRRWSPLWTAAFAGLVTSLLLAALVPVYTDEIGWRFQMRAAIDGVDIMFNDICGPNTLARPPWFMMPARWFSATANLALADPLFVRASGVACAAVWIGLLFVLTRLVERDADNRARMQTILLSLLGLGLLPYLMILSRPEQPVVLATTAIVVIALLPPLSRKAGVSAWAKVAAILILAAIAQSYHLKGVLYSVVAGACLIGCARGRNTLIPRIVGCTALSALTLSSALYWIGRFRCPEDARIATQFAEQSIAGVLAQGGSVTSLILHALHGANPFNYVHLAIPTIWPMSDSPSPEALARIMSPVVGMFLYASWIAAAGLLLVALIGFFWRARWRGLAEPRAVICLAILGCVLVWGASQLQNNTYEASHVLPMLAISFALAWSLPNADRFGHDHAAKVLLPAFVTMALIGQAIVLSVSVAPLLSAARHPGYPEQHHNSASLVGYDEVTKDIHRAMAMSGIPSGQPLKRLLIDDLTYLALQEHRLPLNRLGVFPPWNGNIDDPVTYLRSRDSDGVVIGCKYLPADMLAAASRSGEICAISRDGLNRLGSQSVKLAS